MGKEKQNDTNTRTLPEQFGSIAIGFAQIARDMAKEKDFQKKSQKS